MITRNAGDECSESGEEESPRLHGGLKRLRPWLYLLWEAWWKQVGVMREGNAITPPLEAGHEGPGLPSSDLETLLVCSGTPGKLSLEAALGMGSFFSLGLSPSLRARCRADDATGLQARSKVMRGKCLLTETRLPVTSATEIVRLQVRDRHSPTWAIWLGLPCFGCQDRVWEEGPRSSLMPPLEVWWERELSKEGLPWAWEYFA